MQRVLTYIYIMIGNYVLFLIIPFFPGFEVSL